MNYSQKTTGNYDYERYVKPLKSKRKKSTSVSYSYKTAPQQSIPQRSVEDIMKEYEAWNAANPLEPAQEVAPEPAPEVQAEEAVVEPVKKKAKKQEEPKEEIPVLEKRTVDPVEARRRQAGLNRRHAAYMGSFRKEQEEEAATRAEEDARIAEEDELIKRFAQANGISEEESRAQYEAAKGNAAIGKVDESKALDPQTENRLIRNAKAEAWLDPNHKMTKDEVKEARQMLKDWRHETGGVPHSGDEETNRNMAALEAKTSKLSAVALGMWKPFDNIGNLVGDVVGAAAGGDVKKTLDDQQAYVRNARENAQAQHGGAYTAGNFLGNGLLYMATNPLFDKIGAAAGMGKAGQFALNQVGQNAQDWTLDTIPEVAENIKSGMSKEDVAKEALKNVLFNAGGNLAFGVGGELLNGKLIPQLQANRAAKELAQEEYINGLRKFGDEVLHPLAEDADNIARGTLNAEDLARQNAEGIGDVIAQRNAAADEMERLAQQIPEQPKADLIPEVAKPEEVPIPKIVDEAPVTPTVEEVAKEAPVRPGTANNPDYRWTPEALQEEEAGKIIGLRNGDQEYALPKESIPEAREDFDGMANYLRNELAKYDAAGNEKLATEAAKMEESLQAYAAAIDAGDLDAAEEAARVLNNTRRRIDTALKKVDGYDGMFGQKRIADTISHPQWMLRNSAEDITMDDEIWWMFETADWEKKRGDAINELIDAVDARIQNNPGAAERYAAFLDAVHELKWDSDKAAADKAVEAFRAMQGDLAEPLPKELTDDIGQRLKVAHRYDLELAPKVEAPEAPKADVRLDNRVMADDTGLRNNNPTLTGRAETTITPEDILRDEPDAPPAGNPPVPPKNPPEDILGGGNVPPENPSAPPVPPENPPVPPDGPNKPPRKSRVVTNTLNRSGYFTPEEYDEIIRPMADYVPQEESETLELAKSRLLNDHEGTLSRYMDGKPDYKSFGAADVDAMMLALQEQKEILHNATDEAAIREAKENIRKISLTLRKTGTENGRAVQAFAKWTRTADGAASAADAIAEGQVEDFLAKNPKLAGEIEDVAGEISERVRAIYEGNATPQTRQEIIDAINEVLDRHSKVGKRINDEGVNKIADSILKDNAYDSIQDQLEMMSSGVTRVPDDIIDRVNRLYDEMDGLDFNSKEYVQKEKEAFGLLANSISHGASFGERFDQWRYLSMLFNPTTHIRNIVGNVSFRGINGAKDALAAGIEAAADRVSKASGGSGIGRTKSVLTANDRALVEACKTDGLEHAYRELTGNKYLGAARGIESEMPTWDPNTRGGRAMNAVSRFNSNALSKEDEFFKFGKFQNAMAGYLKANGADASIFEKTDDASKQLVEEARNYAIGQAKIATFQQDGVFGEVASSFGQGTRNWRNSNNTIKKTLGLAADVTIPFKKTPANILESALAYSPLELAKTVVVDTGRLVRGTMKAADYIDNVSKGLTGTAGLIFGAILAREGIISVDTRRSDRAAGFDKDTGKQNLAVKVGNTYIGLDQLIPTAAPLIYGATVYDAMNGGDDNVLDSIVTGAGALANGMTEMTMLQGIADTLSSVRYADSDSDVWASLGGQLASNLASQTIPTLGRKIATTIDPQKRTSYTDKTGRVSKWAGNTGRYLSTKIPMLQQTAEAMKNSGNERLAALGETLAAQPAIDSKGREVQNIGGSMPMRAVNNFLNPLNITTDRSTPLDNERRRLADETGNDKLIPDITTTESKIDGYKLTPQEWTDYQKDRGQTREDMSEAFYNNPQYAKLTDADRAEVFTAIDNLSKAMSQGDFGKEMSKKSQGYAELYRESGPDAVIEEIMKDVKLTSLAKERGGEEASATKGMREAYEKGGDAELNKYMNAKYNPYGLDPEFYRSQVDAGEDLSKYEGYGDALAKYEVEDNEAYRKAWSWGKEQAVAKEAEYRGAVKEAGLTASDSAKKVWENANKSGKNPVEELRNYGEARNAAKDEKGNVTVNSVLEWANSTPGATKEMMDLLKPSSATGSFSRTGGKWVYTDKSGKVREETHVYEPLEKLGMSGKTATQESYDRALRALPQLTPEKYASTVKLMDSNHNGEISQKEAISYFNKYKILELEAPKYWEGLGNPEWKSTVVYKNGEFKTAKKK